VREACRHSDYRLEFAGNIALPRTVAPPADNTAIRGDRNGMNIAGCDCSYGADRGRDVALTIVIESPTLDITIVFNNDSVKSAGCDIPDFSKIKRNGSLTKPIVTPCPNILSLRDIADPKC
jgi:hypothetical protein